MSPEIPHMCCDICQQSCCCCCECSDSEDFCVCSKKCEWVPFVLTHFPQLAVRCADSSESEAESDSNISANFNEGMDIFTVVN